MAPCSNNPECNNKRCPINGKVAKIKENPDSINKMKPSWNFNLCDKEGTWAFTKEKTGNTFWEKILPRLKGFEQQSWGELVNPKKDNHFIEVAQLNKCARTRLEDLHIFEEEILSLRIEGGIRIYGLRPKSTCFILWYDDNHGDNDICVERSRLKHT